MREQTIWLWGLGEGADLGPEPTWCGVGGTAWRLVSWERSRAEARERERRAERKVKCICAHPIGHWKDFLWLWMRWKAIEESLWRLCGDGQGGSIDTI